MAETRRIVFKYELPDNAHDIDAVALSSGLGHFCSLLSFFCDKERKDAILSIRAEAFRPGSFEVYLKLFEIGQGVLGTVVANNFVDAIGNVLEMFKQYIELKAMLGSRKADSITATAGGMVNITYGDNNTIVMPAVINIYMKETDADDYLSGAARATLTDSSIKGLQVQELTSRGQKNIVSLTHEQLRRAALQNGYLAEESRVSTIEDANLLLISPNLEFCGVWRFQYGRRRITAKIEDADFIEKVREGVLDFRSKDVLIADIRVKQTLDPRSGQWEDKDFAIIKVKAINNLRDL